MKLLSGNLWLLPFAASAENRLRKQRFLKLVEQVNPDVICLQEVWQYTDVKFLIEKTGMDAVWSGSRGLYNKGGLLTLSKTPISNVERHSFPTPWSSIIGVVAQKGMLACTVKGKRIVNVHLHDPGSAPQQKYTMSQFEALKAFAGESVVAGDLNIRKDLLKDLNDGFFKLASTNHNTRSKNNKYQHMRKNKFEGNDDQVDYVLSTKRVITTKVLTEPLVSDHYALLAVIP